MNLRVIASVALLLLAGLAVWLAFGVDEDISEATYASAGSEPTGGAASAALAPPSRPAPAVAGIERTNAEPAPALLGSLVGRVVDATGAPVPGAGATASRLSGPILHVARFTTATTGADGRFTLTDLPAGTRYAVILEAPGHVRTKRGDVLVPAGGVGDAGDLVIAAAWTIRGSVAEDGGLPIPGATVTIRGKSYVHETKTDARGRFALAPECDDGGLLSVAAEGFAARDGRPDWRADVRPETAEREWAIVLIRAGTIRGRVTDASGRPLRRASVAATASVPTHVTSGPREAELDGTYVLQSVPRGFVYSVIARAEGHASATRHGVPEGAIGIDFALAPLPYVELAARDGMTGAPLPIFNAQSRFAESGERLPSAVGSAGVARVFCGRAGTLRITVEAFGYRPVEMEPIAVDGVTSVGPLIVRLESSGPLLGDELFGMVVRASDRRPIERFEATVFVPEFGAPWDGARRQWPAPATGEPGRFTFRRPQASRFDIRISARGFAPALIDGIDPASLSADRPIEIALAPGGALRGTVLGFAGEPLPNFPVTGRHARGDHCDTRTGLDGRYRVGDLAPGVWRVGAGASELENAAAATVRDVTIAAGEDVVVDFDLRSFGAAIAGHVTVDGRPRAGLGVWVLREARAPVPGDAPLAARATGDAGEFEFIALPPGDAFVGVGEGAPCTFSPVRLEAGRRVTHEVELKSALFAGTVRDAAGRPLEAWIRLRAVDARHPYGGVRADSDGRFEVPIALPGDYEVSVIATGHAELGRRVTATPGARIEVEFTFAPSAK